MDAWRLVDIMMVLSEILNLIRVEPESHRESSYRGNICHVSYCTQPLTVKFVSLVVRPVPDA